MAGSVVILADTRREPNSDPMLYNANVMHPLRILLALILALSVPATAWAASGSAESCVDAQTTVMDHAQHATAQHQTDHDNATAHQNCQDCQCPELHCAPTSGAVSSSANALAHDQRGGLGFIPARKNLLSLGFSDTPYRPPATS